MIKQGNFHTHPLKEQCYNQEWNMHMDLIMEDIHLNQLPIEFAIKFLYTGLEDDLKNISITNVCLY